MYYDDCKEFFCCSRALSAMRHREEPEVIRISSSTRKRGAVKHYIKWLIWVMNERKEEEANSSMKATLIRTLLDRPFLERNRRNACRIGGFPSRQSTLGTEPPHPLVNISATPMVGLSHRAACKFQLWCCSSNCLLA